MENWGQRLWSGIDIIEIRDPGKRPGDLEIGRLGLSRLSGFGGLDR
jgi:hypothetical protein